MDGSNKVVESLESLWFFNNVLTLPSFEHKGHHGFALHEDTVEEEEEEEEEEESSKPKIQETEILVPRCPKCGEIAAGVEFAKPTEKRKRRRRRRSNRKVLGELDLGLHCKLAYESSFSEENIARPIPNSETPRYTKMPPLNDGLAMKQHLKSWAYAVACTVK
ncbi:uncharacterized protein LOC120175921 [Hibiscus syriacus]|uniref:uncharacterized protein LOC120175921 n=1 Tax=Hibiscus syriacus TaxID=106335 RepID=UPI00192210C2|nr:uncharacterized protein LOC120175921 [Hibiscus syriacus]